VQRDNIGVFQQCLLADRLSTGGFATYYREAVEDIAAWLEGSPVRVL